MKKVVVILGNGFDLDLGLKTSYSDFAESDFWQNLMDNNEHSLDGSRLLGFLNNKYEVEKWIDIEAALLEYALQKTEEGNFEIADDDQGDYLALCGALKRYLLNQQISFKPRENSVGKGLLRRLRTRLPELRVYTFNYTQLDVLAQKYDFYVEDAEHIHGSLIDDGNLILGIDTAKRVDDNYSFLFKTQNRSYRHTDILKDLCDKDEYIFFGHSLNGMDYPYFESLFGQLSHSGTYAPRLTIITKNEDDENRFKNFLRKESVSLQGLYSNSIPTFILTDEIYNKKKEEQKKVQELFDRLDMM